MTKAIVVAACAGIILFSPLLHISVMAAEQMHRTHYFAEDAWEGIGRHRGSVRALDEGTWENMTARSVRRRVLSERSNSGSGRDARKELLQHSPTVLRFSSQHVEMLDLPNSFLLLGEQTPFIAGIKIYPDDEPVILRTVIVRFSDNISSSVSAVEVIDGSGAVLGHARQNKEISDGGNVYTLPLQPWDSYTIGQHKEAIVAIRLRLKENGAGGGGGQDVKVTGISIVSDGVWTQRPRLAETERLHFPAHESALSTITRIERNGAEEGIFTPGTGKRIASFEVAAAMARDADAAPAIQTINFSANYPSSEVTLQNIVLRGNDADTVHTCSINSFVITCEEIPSLIGSLESPRTLSLYADVSVVGTHSNPFLAIDINNPGRPSSAGDISWTDGTTTMTWVPFNWPVVRGTVWR
jgi:hypothetical protein